jgi:hypothetical protein
MHQQQSDNDKRKKMWGNLNNTYIQITVAIGVIASILGIIVFFANDTNAPRQLWLRIINKGWINCDNNFSYDNRHFTYIGGDNLGTCAINLKSGDFIVGTADKGFQESLWPNVVTDKCAAFLFRGPLHKEFSFSGGGGGDFYFATIYNDAKFEEKWAELDNHIECNQSSRGYDKIECNEIECKFLE